MSTTDLSQFGWTLSRPAFFNKLQPTTATAITSGPAQSGEPGSRDLITVQNEVMYMWIAEKRSIIRARCSGVWGNKDGGDGSSDEIDYKEYSTGTDVTFEPTRIQVRSSMSVVGSAPTGEREGDLVLLWCPTGLAVVTLGTDPELGKGEERKTPLSSRVVIPAELTYLEHTGLRILQVKWYPATPGSEGAPTPPGSALHDPNLLAVLNNDNFLRFYSLTRNPEVPQAIIFFGGASAPSVPFTYYSNNSIGLVDAPIDFDFGPLLPASGFQSLFVLRSSGEISYILLKYLATTFQLQVHGNLPKQLLLDPDEIEECFQDPSTLIASSTFPVVLTIGSILGKLYHAVLFPVEVEASDDSFSSATLKVNMEQALLNGEMALFVKEVLEIEPKDDEAGLGFMVLLSDPLGGGRRYAAVHGEGVHIVNMNFMSAVESFFNPSPEDFSLTSSAQTQAQKLGSLDAIGEGSISTHSNIRYVLRCKLWNSTLAEKQDCRQRFQNPYRANFTFSDSIPQKFVMILGPQGHGTAVYDIPHFLGSTDRATAAPDEVDGLSGGAGLNSIETLKSILQKPASANQPLLLRQLPNTAANVGTGSGDSPAPDPEGEDLISDALRTLQREYLIKQEQALKHLSDSLRTLTLDAAEFGEHVTSTAMAELEAIRSTSDRLALEFEAVAAKEVELQARLEALETSRHDSLPVLTDEEKRWLVVLDRLQEDLEATEEVIRGLGIKVTNPLLAQGQDHMQELISATRFSEPQLNGLRLRIARQQQALVGLRDAVMRIQAATPGT